MPIPSRRVTFPALVPVAADANETDSKGLELVRSACSYDLVQSLAKQAVTQTTGRVLGLEVAILVLLQHSSNLAQDKLRLIVQPAVLLPLIL